MVDDNILAVKEQKQIVKDLTSRACEKIHTWLLSKTTQKAKTVSGLKKRQSPLLKYCFLYHFLQQHNPKNAEEISTRYIDIVSKIYGIHFRNHLDKFSDFCLQIADKDDMIGESEASRWNFFSAKIQKKRTPVYSIAQR